MHQNQSKRVAHGLQFNVAQLLKDVTGATRTYDIDTPTVDELDDELKIVSAITGWVKLLRTGRDILVTGSLTTTIQKVCGRCLTDFTAPISVELEEEFFPTLDVSTGAILPTDANADEANRIDEHHILDLWEVVRQEMLLASDDILYCRPDCKGLCPHCGQDRNVNPCTCQDEIIDPRWSGLLTLPQSDNE